MREPDWADANRQFLFQEIDRVRHLLALNALASRQGEEKRRVELERLLAEVIAVQGEAQRGQAMVPAFLQLSALFDLTTFERDVLALCVAVELDASVSALVAELQAERREEGVTWGLVLSAFPEPSWSATLRDAPLRHYGLVNCVDVNGSVSGQHLRLDERVLNYLLGVRGGDARLTAVATPWQRSATLSPRQRSLLPELAAALRSGRPSPCLVLLGKHVPTLRSVAAEAILEAGGQPWLLHGERMQSGTSAEPWLSLLAREWALSGLSLVVDAERLGGAGSAQAREVVERHLGLVVVIGTVPFTTDVRAQLVVDVPSASRAEQKSLWETELASLLEDEEFDRCADAIDAVSRYFVFEAIQVHDAAVRVVAKVRSSEATLTPAHLRSTLWQCALSTCRQSFDGLAQRVEPRMTMDGLMLGPQIREALRSIVAHCRHEATVLGHWGFEARYGSGLGVSVLFSGPSGTGKTSAAEVIAGELGLDLYRVDLASLVSKYIGETEKNLRKVFDAAEAGGAVLLFDEADALFAKRTSVSNSHDRFANLEVSYLLQRMEAFKGVTILTTNLADNLDPAFMRRLRFVVPFSFPDQADRAKIWERVFPEETPTDGLDVERLAQLRISGALIRNIALSAAFWSAERGKPVTMAALYHAARVEYRKSDQPITREELAGWPSEVLDAAPGG